MVRSLTFFLLSLTFYNCTRTYHVRDAKMAKDREPIVQLQERFAKATTEDWFLIELRDGTIMEGTFFSMGDGVVTLRVGDLFREAELADIERLQYKTVGRGLNFWVYPLAGLTMFFIIYSFLNE